MGQRQVLDAGLPLLVIGLWAVAAFAFCWQQEVIGRRSPRMRVPGIAALALAVPVLVWAMWQVTVTQFYVALVACLAAPIAGERMARMARWRQDPRGTR